MSVEGRGEEGEPVRGGWMGLLPLRGGISPVPVQHQVENHRHHHCFALSSSIPISHFSLIVGRHTSNIRTSNQHPT